VYTYQDTRGGIYREVYHPGRLKEALFLPKEKK